MFWDSNNINELSKEMFTKLEYRIDEKISNSIKTSPEVVKLLEAYTQEFDDGKSDENNSEN
jgi:hypothetical protein